MSNKSILFVCMGNICRSPAAEGIFQAFVSENAPAESLEIDSAGTIGYHVGEPADSRMRRSAQQRGFSLESVSRKVVPEDLDHYDLVVAMDRENLRDLKALNVDSDCHICLLSDFLDDAWPMDVPDPYYGGDAGFETVLDMIEAACPKMLQAVQSS